LLERDGLHDFIDVRVYSSEISHVKPHPLAFKAVLAELGVKPAKAVFVGDRKYDDVWGAQSVGMKTVLVVPGPENDHMDVTPDATISDLAELIGVIDRWID
ncbi:MAG: HAD family hydrolase, partial [Acidimicrobiales bacterium]|nr:HAD family hydrolase [Acidimicrobiales bacterium]